MITPEFIMQFLPILTLLSIMLLEPMTEFVPILTFLPIKTLLPNLTFLNLLFFPILRDKSGLSTSAFG